ELSASLSYLSVQQLIRAPLVRPRLSRASSRCRIAVFCADALGPVDVAEPDFPDKTGRPSRRTTVRTRGVPMPNMDTRNSSDDAATRHREHRVEELIARLPYRLGTTARWLRRPSSRWFRIPAGALLIGGSFFSILPVFGIWMLPLGLILPARDLCPLPRERPTTL